MPTPGRNVSPQMSKPTAPRSASRRRALLLVRCVRTPRHCMMALDPWHASRPMTIPNKIT